MQPHFFNTSDTRLLAYLPLYISKGRKAKHINDRKTVSKYKAGILDHEGEDSFNLSSNELKDIEWAREMVAKSRAMMVDDSFYALSGLYVGRR